MKKTKNKDYTPKPKKKKLVSGGNIAKMLLTVFAIGGVGLGIYALINSTKVSVCTVQNAGNSMDVVFSNFDSYLYYDASLQTGSVEDVKLSSTLTIKKVNVKKGDTVKKGDVLIEYDIHDLEDQAADSQLLVTKLTNNMEMLQNEIKIIERLQPSENKPVVQEETPYEEQPEEQPEEHTPETDTDKKQTGDTPLANLPKKFTKDSVPLAGKGTLDDPYIFYSTEDGVVTKELLEKFAESKDASYAAFYVCDEAGNPLFARVIDSSKIDKSSIEDFKLSDGVTITPTGDISFSGKSAEFASFVLSGSSASGGANNPDMSSVPEGFELPEEFELPPEYAQQLQNQQAQIPQEQIPQEQIPQTPASSDLDISEGDMQPTVTANDNYMYSLKELREMIKSRQEQKAALDLQKRQAELAVKNAKRLAKTGGEVSPISGEVTFVAKDKFHLSQTDAYLTITNSEGMTLTSHVGEYSRDLLEVGMSVIVRSYPSDPVEGTISYIGDTPLSLSEVSTKDSFESQYEFRVVLNNNIETSMDSTFMIEIHPNENKEKGIVLPSALVRREAGRAYVMMDNGSGVLKKQYVTIGDANLNTTEIVDGLKKTDFIAFPYGKAVEGAKTKETDYNTMCYGGFF
ncbi:MAG: biotin/lipoyl-binding protein [Clostridia bacterium]|nr:biotin/lipoyl-binding protein [Clostridia bacterium]